MSSVQARLLGAAPSSTLAPASSAAVRSHCAAAAANFFWGAGTVVMKLGLQQYHEDPIVFALYRETAVALILLVAARCVGGAALRSAHAPRMLLTGLCLFGTQLSFILGVNWGGATVATFWQPVLPVTTAAIAIAAGHEPLTARRAAAIACCVAGALVMVVGGHDLGKLGKDHAFWGNCALLVQAFTNGTYLVVMKPLLKDYAPLSVTAWAYCVASASMAVVAAARYAMDGNGEVFAMCGAMQSPNYVGFVPLVYWVLLGSCGGYSLVTYANVHLRSSVVSTYSTTQPVYGVALAIPLLHTQLHWQDSGAILIVLGLFVISQGAAESEQF